MDSTRRLEEAFHGMDPHAHDTSPVIRATQRMERKRRRFMARTVMLLAAGLATGLIVALTGLLLIVAPAFFD
jgi:hypothetical protein